MPAPRQRALGFVIEGEGNYREPQHRASWPSTFQSRDCAPTHPREICSARSLRSTCDCSISEAASRMGISRQSLHPGSPPQSRAVRWRGAPSPAGRGNRSRSRRRAPQWRRWEPVAPDHCLAGREVEFPSFRSAPRTESLQTLCWREMDSNRRSSAEFGNFVLAGVSFGVSQSSNGLWTVPATPSVVPLRRRMMSAQSPSAHVALVADLSTSCSDSQVTRH